MISAAGIFISEGTSDHPLADIVERLFQRAGVDVILSTPDFALLPQRVRSTVDAKLHAGYRLMGATPRLVVVHRDADSAGREARLAEIQQAVVNGGGAPALVPVVPIRMTEAWLLLDEVAIRRTAGNPRGKAPLGLPRRAAVERIADPKAILREALLTAADETGRKRKVVKRRFDQHRGQLLERLDIDGDVRELEAWKHLVDDIPGAAAALADPLSTKSSGALA